MNLIDTLQQAFSNETCIKKLKESLELDDIQVDASADGVKIVFEQAGKLDTLLLKPLLEHVGPKQRRTQTGVQHVSGYTRENPKPDIEALIKAEESDSDVDEKTDAAFQEFIECCLESVDGKSITIE